MAGGEERRPQMPASDYSSQSSKSELACSLCKRRKTKCDRVLPTCGPCDRTAQSCLYPSKRMKPGPKLGSRLHERRRPRNRGRHSQDKGHRKRQKDSDSVIVSSKYDQRSQAPPDSTGSHQILPPPRPETILSNVGLDDLASLPTSPISTDPDGEPTDLSDSSELAATNFVRAISLSSLIHPTHESRHQPLSRAAPVLSDGFFINLVGAQRLIDQACETMSISVSDLQALTDLYLDNMTAFSLFHRPTFGAKIQGITTLAPLVALLASMFSISIKFYPACSEASHPDPVGLPSSDQFHRMATKAVEDALKDADDEAPSLAVLQAMVLCTFNELIRGVRGKGWRLLGSCVRVAYEQHLNLVDYGAATVPPNNESDIRQWVSKEEQRRCWWSIWEMDVFASTIRRCPLAIDWSMNETYLPIHDDSWFSNIYCQSSFLDMKPRERWKKLKKCDNQSPTAWFIVLSSIMRDAQTLARGTLQGIRSEWRGQDETTDLQQYFYNVFRKKSPVVGNKQLYFLSHALQQTVSAMPDALAYKGERLFSSADGVQEPDSGSALAQEMSLDVSRYSIFLMTQLARFQIFHHYAFGEITSGTLFTENPPNPPFGWTSAPDPPSGSISNCEGLRNCLEAADNILFVLKNVPEWHVKWLNPFLASTVWLAASLQILRKVYALGKEDEAESKFSLLRLTCQRYSLFWGTPLTLLQNVDSLERRLRHRRDLMAQMEACSMENQRTARLRWDKGTPKSALVDGSNSFEGRITERMASDLLTSIDFMPDLYDPAAFLTGLEGLSAEGKPQSASSSPTTTDWLSILPERSGELEDLSLECHPYLFFPRVPAPETTEYSQAAGDSSNGLDHFASEFIPKAR